MSDFTGFGMQDHFQAIIAEREREIARELASQVEEAPRSAMPNRSVVQQMNIRATANTRSRARALTPNT